MTNRQSVITHNIETNLVAIYPVRVDGTRLEGTETPTVVLVDGERIVIPSDGALIEKWKADVVMGSMCYRHLYTPDVLKACGVDPTSPEWEAREGTAIEPEEFPGVIRSYTKYQVREPSQEEMFSVTKPIDQDEFDRVAQLNSRYTQLAMDYGDEIKAAMRANSETSVERLFMAFELAFMSNQDAE